MAILPRRSNVAAPKRGRAAADSDVADVSSAEEDPVVVAPKSAGAKVAKQEAFKILPEYRYKPIEGELGGSKLRELGTELDKSKVTLTGVLNNLTAVATDIAESTPIVSRGNADDDDDDDEDEDVDVVHPDSVSRVLFFPQPPRPGSTDE